MAIGKLNYPAGTTTITISPENVASQSAFTSGVQSAAIANTGNLDFDHHVSGFWTCGTTPTINTQAILWVVPCLADDLLGTITWPDQFGASAAARSVTSASILLGVGAIGRMVNIDSTTSNRTYPFAQFSVASLFGNLPTNYVLYLAHNSGVNSNSTAGNFVFQYQRFRNTVN